MHVTHSVDWLRWTVDAAGNPPLDAVDTDLECFARTPGEIRPAAPYASALRLLAASVYWHVNRPELKTMVEMRGADWCTARELGVSEGSVLRHVKQTLGNVTRLDLAIDVFEGETTPYQTFLYRRSGRMKTRASSARFIRGMSAEKLSGDTLYIGSRQSERYIRIYDKAAENGMSADWVRVELELKGRTAQRAAGMCLGVGVADAARSYASDSIQIEKCQWWSDVLGTEPMEKPPVVPRKDTDGLAWLLETVLPRLERALLFEDTDGTLRQATDDMLKRIDNGGYDT